ncbi:MAG: HD-GYP domain-containing protein [Bacteroidota bacterium]
MSDPHYLRRVVSLGDKCRVVTHRPITNERGIKLVDSGVHITTSLYDKLVMHKLLPELDECLSVENAVTPQSVVADIRQLLASNFGQLLGASVDVDQLLAMFAAIPLNRVLAFKLTVVREQAPGIYRHSLDVALCAAVLSMHLPATRQKLQIEAAAAGLLHDLGLLHIDPVLLEGDAPLSEAGRRHIYSHPVVGHLLLSRFSEWHPVVSRAVLEHHERLDASGYPRGLAGAELGRLGQLLAVAELAATLFSREHFMPLADCIHIILRLNQGKLNPDICALLTGIALHGDARAQVPTAAPAYADVLAELIALSTAIQSWRGMLPDFGKQPVIAWISDRLELVERNLAGVGIDLQYWAMVDAALPDDQLALRELLVGVKEGRWQLRAIAQEVHRRWDDVPPAIQPSVRNWLQHVEEPAPGG